MDNNNKEVKPKREYVKGLSLEEKKERIREQKRRWFQKYCANEENRKIHNAYNNAKQKEYNALKKQQTLSTF